MPVLYGDPTVTLPPVHPQSIPKEIPKRLTVREAADQVRKSGRLDGAQDFFDKLMADIERITGRRVVTANVKFPERKNFDAKLTTMLSHIRPIKKQRVVAGLEVPETFPMGQISYFSAPGVSTFKAEFTLPLVDHKCHQITMQDASFKHPDDFTRSIPPHAKRKLAALSQTNFDYQPMILDGELTRDHVVGKRQPFLLALQDPAIAIDIDGGKYAIDHWREPWQGDIKRSLISFVKHPAWVFSLVLPALLLVILGVMFICVIAFCLMIVKLVLMFFVETSSLYVLGFTCFFLALLTALLYLVAWCKGFNECWWSPLTMAGVWAAIAMVNLLSTTA